MTIMRTIDEEINAITTANQIYNDYELRWQYLLESYLGGDEWRDSMHLTQYVNETPAEYAARVRATHLENHCASVIQVYNSFLFRTEPERELGTLEDLAVTEQFLKDADLDGRSLNAFMKDVATWASVFGHCWIIIAKPNLNLQTLSEEQQLGVRPYVNLMNPLTVRDWTWQRTPMGGYKLSYIKYIEEINGSVQTVKEWTTDTVRTVVVDLKERYFVSDVIEANQLGYIPCVLAYNARSTVRGIGVSDITDIADAQRSIYNCLSEIEQSIRVDSHPSLVKTPDTQAGVGAGSIIQIPENLDPGLKPYILEYNGASVDAILKQIEHIENSIDKMANTGAVRATESRTMSGVAMQTEFQLLNARLSDKAQNLELAEEQIWRIFADYQGVTYDGEITYPGSFNIRDQTTEFEHLKMARDTATDPAVFRVIDQQLLEALDEEAELEDLLPEIEMPESLAIETSTGSCPVATQDIALNLANRQTAIDTARYGPLNPALPNTVFWAAKADMWNTDTATARQSVCGNCSFFVQTTQILACIDSGLAAGGATGNEWDSVGGGQLGYCEAFDFKCKSTRTCDAWVAGGPVTDATATPEA